eukprot:1088116-Prymnesium_polylepis.1
MGRCRTVVCGRRELRESVLRTCADSGSRPKRCNTVSAVSKSNSTPPLSSRSSYIRCKAYS